MFIVCNIAYVYMCTLVDTYLIIPTFAWTICKAIFLITRNEFWLFIYCYWKDN